MTSNSKKVTGDMFGGHAALYEAARPTYPQALYEYITRLCATTERVWDCATGTGQAARPLAKYFDTVFATDVSEQQISEAKGSENILYSTQSSESTNFSDNTFDLVTVAQALHWFDYEKFWNEVDRVLKPQGVFVAWGYDWTKINFDIDFLLQDNLYSLLDVYWNPKAKILWGGYETEEVKFPYERIDTPAFSIELNWNLDQLFQYFLSWSSVQAYIKENGTELIENAKAHVTTVWGDPNETKLIQWPIHMLVGRKV